MVFRVNYRCGWIYSQSQWERQAHLLILKEDNLKSKYTRILIVTLLLVSKYILFLVCFSISIDMMASCVLDISYRLVDFHQKLHGYIIGTYPQIDVLDISNRLVDFHQNWHGYIIGAYPQIDVLDISNRLVDFHQNLHGYIIGTYLQIDVRPTKDWNVIAVFTLKIGTPEVLTILILKFEQVHFTTYQCVWKMSSKQCRPRSDVSCVLWYLFRVYTVCTCLSVLILWVITLLI